MGSKQLGHRFAEGFAYIDYEQTTAKKRTRRERFLAEMEKVVPWKALIDLIEPHYPKTSSKGGRPPYPLATMLRIHLLQQWYHRCAEGFAYGLKVHNRYAEAKGYGVDSESGLIHSVETTAANVHDLTPASDLLHGEETLVAADAGYQGIEKRDEMKGRGIGFRVAMRPGKRRVLPDTPEGRLDDLVETAKAHIRAKGEHPFRVIKQQFGFQKTRLRGMLLPRPQAERGGATRTAAK
jgi:hypothetical protein